MNNYSFRVSFLIIAMLLGTSKLQADNQSIPSFQNGFYLGGALGAGWGHSTWNGISKVVGVNDNGAPLNVFESWIPNGQRSATNFLGRAMLGYQILHNPFYLAAELGGTFSKEYQFGLNNTQIFNQSFLGYTFINVQAILSDQATLGSSEFNLDLKPGWLFQENFLIYGRAGLAVNQLTISNNGTWINNSSTFSVPTQLIVQDSSMVSNTACGIRLGLGGEYLIAQNVGITIDYTYTYYGSIATKAGGRSSASSGDVIVPVNLDGLDAPIVDISSQAFMLGLIYHW